MLPQQRYLNNLRLAANRRKLDSHWGNVVLLADFNGADGSTAMTDLSAGAHVLTANADAQLDTAQFKFGTASLLLDGTDDYVSAPDSDDWHFGSGDFTVEAHIRQSALDAGAIVSQHINTTAIGWGLRLNVTPAVNFFWNGGLAGSGGGQITNAATISTDTWYHVAVCRSGNTLYMFLDGVMLGSGDALSDTFNDSSSPLNIGATNNGAADLFQGWIDNLRITKGVARYTANFTPPDREYPTR